MAGPVKHALRPGDAPADSAAGKRAERNEARRTELAEAALETLAEIGYARTSVREIAQNSAFTHGILHYYFDDKVDLICCCVRHYKAKCVTRYDGVTATAATAPELVDGFVAKLTETLLNEARMHRLWYDLRAQALYEPAFRGDVKAIDRSLEDMVWRVASTYAALRGAPVRIPRAALYALVDGLFQKALLGVLSGDQEAAAADLEAEMRGLMPMIA